MPANLPPPPPCSAAAGRAAALPDHLGTVRALLDPAGGQVSRFRFGPFGVPLSAEGPDRIGFGHSGKEWFERTGLVYYGQRWYHPESGRWLSRDPAGEAGGLNLYGFCRNDPVNCYDLDGLAPKPRESVVPGSLSAVIWKYVGGELKFLPSFRVRQERWVREESFHPSSDGGGRMSDYVREGWDELEEFKEGARLGGVRGLARVLGNAKLLDNVRNSAETDLRIEEEMAAIGARRDFLRMVPLGEGIYQWQMGNRWRGAAMAGLDVAGIALGGVASAGAKGVWAGAGRAALVGGGEAFARSTATVAFDRHEMGAGYGRSVLDDMKYIGGSTLFGAGFAATPGLGARLFRRSPKIPASFFRKTRFEVEALQRQGLSRSEAFAQIRRFNAGNADGFAFHFTNPKGATGILGDSAVNSGLGIAGRGVYAGTTPTPSALLKYGPTPGWALTPTKPVRIPLRISPDLNPVRPVIPFRTQVFRVDQVPLKP